MTLLVSEAARFSSFRPPTPGLPLQQMLLPDLDPEHALVSVDTLNVGVHFGADDDPSAVGHKSLAVNLSDMAAMGAQARWATLALRLPAELSAAWFDGFRSGFDSLAHCSGVCLGAFDVGEGPLSATVEVIGTAPPGASLRRAGAHVGDRVLVSGTLGDAAYWLRQRLAGVKVGNRAQSWLEQRLDRPSPRLELGALLRDYATSAIDVSDGLVSDLGHILAASRVGASLETVRLPLSEALRACAEDEHALRCALSGGDDYELCFTVPPDRAQTLIEAARRLELQITDIGEIDAQSGLRMLDANGAQFTSMAKGYDHFLP